MAVGEQFHTAVDGIANIEGQIVIGSFEVFDECSQIDLNSHIFVGIQRGADGDGVVVDRGDGNVDGDGSAGNRGITTITRVCDVVVEGCRTVVIGVGCEACGVTVGQEFHATVDGIADVEDQIVIGRFEIFHQRSQIDLDGGVFVGVQRGADGDGVIVDRSDVDVESLAHAQSTGVCCLHGECGCAVGVGGVVQREQCQRPDRSTAC